MNNNNILIKMSTSFYKKAQAYDNIKMIEKLSQKSSDSCDQLITCDIKNGKYVIVYIFLFFIGILTTVSFILNIMETFKNKDKGVGEKRFYIENSNISYDENGNLYVKEILYD